MKGIVRTLGGVALSGLLLGIAVLGRNDAVAASGVTVSINAPSQAVQGSGFTVSVDIGSVTTFDAGQFDVSFDESLVELDNVTAGQIGATQIPVDLWSKIATGTYRIIANVPGVPGVSGSGSLAVLHFHAASSTVGTSAVNLSNGFLNDNLATEIAATWTGASISVCENPVVMAPSVATSAATGIDTTAATLNGNLTSLGTASTVQVLFEYGETTAYGSTTPDQPMTANGTFSAPIGAGLDCGKLYHFRAKAVGDATAYGEDQTFTTAACPIPPSAVLDLSATTATATSVTLTWIAPGDDGNTGTASTYDIRYSTATITDGNWKSTSQCNNEPTPKVAGSPEAFTVTGLSPNTTYYFAVKTADAVPNWSGLSNVVDKRTALMDTTPPTTPVVTDDGGTTTSTSQLHATWSSSDPESGIAEYQYAIGSTSGGTDTLGWTSVGTNTEVTNNELSLTVRTEYFISVKAQNGAGLWSEVGISNGITVVDGGMAVEDVPPAGGTVETADGKITADFPANIAVGELTVVIEHMASPPDTSTLQGFKAGNTYFVIEITDARGNPVVTLSESITITVKYSQEDADAAGGDPNDLVLAYYDKVAGEWKPLDTMVNTSDKTLSATTTHLCTWAVLAKTTSASHGLPPWIWVVIGLAAVAMVGVTPYMVYAGLTKRTEGLQSARTISRRLRH